MSGKSDKKKFMYWDDLERRAYWVERENMEGREISHRRYIDEVKACSHIQAELLSDGYEWTPWVSRVRWCPDCGAVEVNGQWRMRRT